MTEPEHDQGSLVPESDQELLDGGPGGQHQNRTESAVRLTHRATGIRVTARESRSQHRNRRTALSRLREALAAHRSEPQERRPTRVPERERRRRLEEKRRRSAVKRRRRPPDRDEG